MKIIFFYFLEEIISSFLLGIAVFIGLITLTQFMQLSEFMLIHGVGFIEVLKIVGLMSVSFIPIVLPMSLLFSVLLTYTRLSSDSEIVALKSFGYSPLKLALPAICFSFLITILSAQVLFLIGPVARFDFDQTIQRIGGQKIVQALHEKTFVEDFFGMVIYFNEKGKDNELQKIFIKDFRDAKNPITIVAQSGNVYTSNNDNNQVVKIELHNGKMFDIKNAGHLSLTFDKYDLTVLSPLEKSQESRDMNTYTGGELKNHLNSAAFPEKKSFQIEWNRRTSLSFACLIFGLLGSGLGMSVNRRSSSSKGFIMSIICLAIFWTLLAMSINIAEKYNFPTALILWSPNVIFLVFTLFLWTKIRKGYA